MLADTEIYNHKCAGRACMKMCSSVSVFLFCAFAVAKKTGQLKELHCCLFIMRERRGKNYLSGRIKQAKQPKQKEKLEA